MHAAEHCLKYLAGTHTEGIRYGRDNTPLHDERGPHQLWGFVDADFASDAETRRSHTGYCLFLNGGPISWKSTRQQSVSLSTAEAEWYAASEAGKEIVYLRYILDDFGLKQRGPSKMYEDSRAVICMTENPVNHKASRHIDTRRYWIGEAVAAKVIRLLPCTTQKMVADALTKSLPAATFRARVASHLQTSPQYTFDQLDGARGGHAACSRGQPDDDVYYYDLYYIRWRLSSKGRRKVFAFVRRSGRACQPRYSWPLPA